jgi:hypothetical protein
VKTFCDVCKRFVNDHWPSNCPEGVDGQPPYAPDEIPPAPSEGEK